MGMPITILEEKRLQDQAQYEAFIATFETMHRNKEIYEYFGISMKVLSRLLTNELREEGTERSRAAHRTSLAQHDVYSF